MKERKIIFGIFRIPDDDGSLSAKIFNDLGVEDKDGLTESSSAPYSLMEYVEVREIGRCFLVDHSSSINHPSLLDGEEVLFELLPDDRRTAHQVRRAFPQKRENHPPGFDEIRWDDH